MPIAGQPAADPSALVVVDRSGRSSGRRCVHPLTRVPPPDARLVSRSYGFLHAGLTNVAEWSDSRCDCSSSALTRMRKRLRRAARTSPKPASVSSSKRSSADAQHAGEHLDPAVGGEHQRPPALADPERLDVLADLAVEVRAGVGSDHRHDVPLDANPRSGHDRSHGCSLALTLANCSDAADRRSSSPTGPRRWSSPLRPPRRRRSPATVALLGLLVAGGALLVGRAALDGTAETVWTVVGGLLLIGAVVPRWSPLPAALGRRARRSARQRLRSLLDSGGEASAVVIETTEFTVRRRAGRRGRRR